MTDKRDKTVRMLTAQEAYERWGRSLAERENIGDAEAGWARLQGALAYEEAVSKQTENAQRARKERLLALHRKRRRISLQILTGASLAVVSIGFYVVSSGLWWLMPASALLLFVVEVASRKMEKQGEMHRRQLAEKYRIQTVNKRHDELVKEADRLEKELEAALDEHCLKDSTTPPKRLDSDMEKASVKWIQRINDHQAGDISRPCCEVFVGADLTGANLMRASLVGVDLSGAVIDGNSLRGANLYGANLCGASLFGADLYRAELTKANLAGANLSGACLLGAHMKAANLNHANLTGANLSNTLLSRADFSFADMPGAILSGADLSDADFSSADLSSTLMSNAHLHSSNLSRTTLVKANLRGVYLYKANLSSADLRGARFVNARLNHVNLIDADLSGAFFSTLDVLQDVIWSERTVWGKYREEVIQNSVPIGRGRYKLNPPDGTANSGIPLVPKVPV